MNTLSVIIICQNEAAHIRACLESVRFADEIIVLDSGSTDQTLEIVREFTDRAYLTDWPGYGPQKNRALAHATGDWVLSIDADEHLSESLQLEIAEKIQLGDTTYNGYAIPRQSSYLGQRIRYGDWRYDQPTRLFRRHFGEFSNDAVHERLNVKGKVGLCEHAMNHEAFTTVDEVLGKMNSYSSLGAKSKAERGQRSSLAKAITHGLWTFLRGYVLRLGFLDGAPGFLLALSNAEGCFYRYIKLAFMTRHEDKPQP